MTYYSQPPEPGLRSGVSILSPYFAKGKPPRGVAAGALSLDRLLCAQVEAHFITAGRGMVQVSTHRIDRGGPWLSTQSLQMRSLCARRSLSETGRSMGAI